MMECWNNENTDTWCTDNPLPTMDQEPLTMDNRPL